MTPELVNALSDIFTMLVILIIVRGLVPATNQAREHSRRREEQLRRKYPDPFMRERMRGL